MARVIGGILGKKSGKIGNEVHRIVNGKEFTSNRPAKYNISQSKAAVAHRAKFSVMIEFAKYINSIPVLSGIWKTAKVKGTTSFNRIVKYNSRAASEKSPTIYNIITPSENVPSKNIIAFPLREFHFFKEANTIKVILSDSSSSFEYNQEYDLTFVLMFLEPIRKKDKYFSLEHIEESCNITKDLSEINIELDDSLNVKLNKYKRLIIYFSASRLVGGRRKYIWSSTFAKEFPLEP